jgi:DNA-directed RNA polymerase subunit omega
MARVTVEDCLEKENNRFALVILAAQRAKQLLSGSKSLITDSDNKHVVNALREIADGKVRFMTEEDLRIKREKEQAEREVALEQAKVNASTSQTNGTNGHGTTNYSKPVLADSEEGFEDEDSSDE